MPYTITWRHEGLLWTFYGVLNDEDVIQANLDVYGDSRFDDLRYQIVDISDVERFELSVEAMEEAASMDDAASLSNPNLIVAVIAATEDARRVARMYESAMAESRWKVRLFSCMEDAEKWTGSMP